MLTSAALLVAYQVTPFDMRSATLLKVAMMRPPGGIVAATF
ncbi:hypothetical protein QP178_15965 [Sphingomonas aurantiaca]|jgi:hypothetical protein|nr:MULTISPECIES: hypothetical protein [Sphingomonas]